jgi:hypothetical protein
VLKLVARREALKLCESAGDAAAKERKIIDAKIIYLLGNAVRGTLADGRFIEAKTVRVKGYAGYAAVPPTSYRPVKIKGKSDATSERTNRGTGPQQAPDHF